MAFMALAFVSAGAQASDQSQAPGTPVAVGTLSPNPLTQLPGMRLPAGPQNPARLPGMGSAPALSFPEEVISDVSNAPNPFDSRRGGLNGQTQISYHLSGPYAVRITLYDLTGFRVRQWEFSPGQSGGRAGLNQVLWDGTNEAGRKVSKGGYLAQIEVDTGKTVATALRKIGVIH